MCWPGLYSSLRHVAACYGVESMKMSGGDPGALYSMGDGVA